MEKYKKIKNKVNNLSNLPLEEKLSILRNKSRGNDKVILNDLLTDKSKLKDFKNEYYNMNDI